MKNCSSFLLAGCCLCLTLSGCVPVAIVGGTAIVGSVAFRNTAGVTGKLSDITIQSRIHSNWAKYDVNINDRLNVFAKGGYALITGFAMNAHQKAKALEIAQKILPAERIYDEIRIGDRQGAGRYSSDAALTSKVSSAIFANGKLRSFNFNTTTLDGVVYIIGLTNSEAEMNIAIETARNIRGVVKVVSYIRVIKEWEK